MDPQPIDLSGRVMRNRTGEGSKSDRVAVTLQGNDGRTYVLRRQGGPAFGDASLEALVGSALTVQGVTIGNTLIMRDWQRRD